MKVLYLNVHDESYPRNNRIRQYLMDAGHDVVMASRRTSTSYFRVLADTFLSGVRHGRGVDAIVLSELSIKYSVAAWLAARCRRSLFVADAFVGWHETTIEDWGKYAGAGLRARGYLAVDRFAVRHSDLTLTDTVIRARRLHEWGAKHSLALPVGAPEWAGPASRLRNVGEPVSVLYYGNFIPLHGLEYVLRTIAALPTDRFQFTFIGDGEARPGIEQLARELDVHSRIRWLDGMTPAELREHIVAADVVLGIFGESPKARSVLANKVWQGLSVGRYVITRTSDALAELRPVVGREQLIEVDPSDGRALERALQACADRVQSEEYPDYSASADKLEAYVAGMYDEFGTALVGTAGSA